jgi:hypothetical protein
LIKQVRLPDCLFSNRPSPARAKAAPRSEIHALSATMDHLATGWVPATPTARKIPRYGKQTADGVGSFRHATNGVLTGRAAPISALTLLS